MSKLNTLPIVIPSRDNNADESDFLHIVGFWIGRFFRWVHRIECQKAYANMAQAVERVNVIWDKVQNGDTVTPRQYKDTYSALFDVRTAIQNYNGKFVIQAFRSAQLPELPQVSIARLRSAARKQLDDLVRKYDRDRNIHHRAWILNRKVLCDSATELYATVGLDAQELCSEWQSEIQQASNDKFRKDLSIANSYHSTSQECESLIDSCPPETIPMRLDTLFASMRLRFDGTIPLVIQEHVNRHAAEKIRAHIQERKERLEKEVDREELVELLKDIKTLQTWIVGKLGIPEILDPILTDTKNEAGMALRIHLSKGLNLVQEQVSGIKDVSVGFEISQQLCNLLDDTIQLFDQLGISTKHTKKIMRNDKPHEIVIDIEKQHRDILNAAQNPFRIWRSQFEDKAMAGQLCNQDIVETIHTLEEERNKWEELRNQRCYGALETIALIDETKESFNQLRQRRLNLIFGPFFNAVTQMELLSFDTFDSLINSVEQMDAESLQSELANFKLFRSIEDYDDFREKLLQHTQQFYKLKNHLISHRDLLSFGANAWKNKQINPADSANWEALKALSNEIDFPHMLRVELSLLDQTLRLAWNPKTTAKAREKLEKRYQIYSQYRNSIVSKQQLDSVVDKGELDHFSYAVSLSLEKMDALKKKKGFYAAKLASLVPKDDGNSLSRDRVYIAVETAQRISKSFLHYPHRLLLHDLGSFACFWAWGNLAITHSPFSTNYMKVSWKTFIEYFSRGLFRAILRELRKVESYFIPQKGYQHDFQDNLCKEKDYFAHLPEGIREQIVLVQQIVKTGFNPINVLPEQQYALDPECVEILFSYLAIRQKYTAII